MSELAINQIITIANAEMQSTRDHLEVEESGRRHTIVITHSPEVQEAIGQKIEMRRTE